MLLLTLLPLLQQLLQYFAYFLIASIAGFEMPLHFVNESAGVQEVCVVVTNPALDQPLYLAIPVQYSTVPGSAGNVDSSYHA